MQNENYEELKGTAKTFLQLVTSDKLYYAIFLFVVLIVAVKVIDLVFLPFKKKRESVQMNFMKGCLKAFVIITIGIKLCSLSDAFSGFAGQILMSSSLIVVVLGFVFQEGLSNIVHGFILSIFKPFQIGDRVHITIDGEAITGYVKSIDLRHTVIQNVVSSSHVIVPNSKMDLCVIDNNYYDERSISTNFVDVLVTYESNLDRAFAVMSEVIETNPLVMKCREKQHITGHVVVLVRELGESGISLRAAVTTMTVEENFMACSDVRRGLVARFSLEPEVKIAYPHVQVVGDARTHAAVPAADRGALK